MKQAWLVALVVTALLVACGGDSSSSVERAQSAEAEFLRDRVVAAMRRVVSYRVDADPGGGLLYSIEYERPDSYHTSSMYDYPGAGSNEGIFVGNKRYLGGCHADGAGCDWAGPFRRRDLLLTVGGEASPIVLPQWPIVAFEMATGLVLSTDGGEVHLRGKVNHIRAIATNSERWMGTIPKEDLKALNVNYYDSHPATMDAVIDTQTHLVKSVTVTGDWVRTPEPLTGVFHIVFTYSRYDDITIEAPE